MIMIKSHSTMNFKSIPYKTQRNKIQEELDMTGSCAPYQQKAMGLVQSALLVDTSKNEYQQRKELHIRTLQ